MAPFGVSGREPGWPGSPSPGQCLCPSPFTSVLVGKLSTGGGRTSPPVQDHRAAKGPASLGWRGWPAVQPAVWAAAGGVPRIVSAGG